MPLNNNNFTILSFYNFSAATVFIVNQVNVKIFVIWFRNPPNLPNVMIRTHKPGSDTFMERLPQYQE